MNGYSSIVDLFALTTKDTVMIARRLGAYVSASIALLLVFLWMSALDADDNKAKKANARESKPAAKSEKKEKPSNDLTIR